MAARRFLWVVAIATVVVIAAGFAYAIFGAQLMRLSMTPRMAFTDSAAAAAPDYATPGGWWARPGMANDPSRLTFSGYANGPADGVATFYLAPTVYIGRDRWTMPFDDAATNDRLARFIQGQASVFNGVGPVYAPRYRQAVFGAFLTEKPDARKALDFAYADVLRAFDAFVAALPPGQPILLAGHSQGSLHLLHLLHDRVAGTPLASRVVAVYAVGWPVSITADLPALGLPQCTAYGQSNCLLSWQSFAEPPDASQIRALYDAGPGYTGRPRKGTAMVCTSPLNGRAGGKAPIEANLGALGPAPDGSGLTLLPNRAAANCDRNGLLHIGPPPFGFDRYVLPGNNYHVYDYALFWANLRRDVEARAADWRKRHPA